MYLCLFYQVSTYNACSGIIRQPPTQVTVVKTETAPYVGGCIANRYGSKSVSATLFCGVVGFVSENIIHV